MLWAYIVAKLQNEAANLGDMAGLLGLWQVSGFLNKTAPWMNMQNTENVWHVVPHKHLLSDCIRGKKKKKMLSFYG